MADETAKTPGSITEQADNSNERISEISNVNRTISNMQKKIDQQLGEMNKDVGSSEAISSIQSSMTKVLSKLSTTVGDIGKGFGKISVDVAKSGKDVISQYGRAIGQDVNYNKQNIVAMALSKSTPIYGYFISKFMETDVWKSASARMKENIGNALSSVGQKLKNVIGGLKFSRSSKKDTDSLSKQARSVKVPHMAKGGIVEKAGLAKLHAAEVVMPVDKLLSRIDDQLTVTKTMAKNVEQGQLHSMAKMNTYVGSLENYQKHGLIKGFFTALKDVQTQYEEPSQQRSLRALLSIQDILGAQVGSWTQVWQKMLIQHPSFRNTMLVGNILRKLLAAPFAPIYSIFKGRGGYKGHLSKSKSPLEALNENIGSLYTGTMFRLDAISTYTKATAEATRDISSAFTGAKYEKLPGIKTGRWSIFGMARKVLNFGTKFLVKSLGNIVSIPMEYAHLGPKFDKVADLLTQQIKLPKLKSRAYFNDAYSNETPMDWKGFFDKYFPSSMAKIIEKQNAIPMFDINATTIKTEQEKVANTSEKILKITEKNWKSNNEENDTSKKILKIADKNWRNDLKDFNLSKKSLKYAEANFKENKQANERSRRQSIFGFLSGGFGAVKGLLSSAMGFILPLMGAGGLFGITGGVGSGIINLIRHAFLGKSKAAAGTSILGAMGKKIVNVIKAITIKFPKGFLKKIGPSLLKMGTGIVNLGKTIGSSIVGLFSNPAVISGLAGALSVAVAGIIGWKIGKSIDEVLGISKKLQAQQTRIDKHEQELLSVSGKRIQEDMQAAKKPTEKGYAARFNLAAQTSFGVDNKRKLSDVGFTGRHNIIAINDAQSNFMRDNINEYMKFTPETISSMRKQWLEEGGYVGHGFGTDPEAYGKRRETAFLKFLNAKGKKMTNVEAFKREAEFKIKAGYKEGVNKIPEIKDAMVGFYSNTKDMVKHQVSEAVLTTQGVAEVVKATTANVINASKEAAGKIGNAVSQNSIVVSNAISNTSSTVTNGVSKGLHNIIDQYNDALIRGDIDGD